MMAESEMLAAKLKMEGEKVITFLANLSEHQWNIDVFTEDNRWTIRSVLAHLMTTERAFLRLFTQVLQGGPGVSEDFDIDRYNASQQRKTAGFNPSQLLEAYRVARLEMVAFVSQLSETDLEKQGRHPFLGQVTLGEMIKMINIHNQTHYRDIRRVLQSQSI